MIRIIYRWCWLCRGWRSFVKRTDDQSIICSECCVIVLGELEETTADIAAEAMRALAADALD